MKELHITLDEKEYKEIMKLKNKRNLTWKDLLLSFSEEKNDKR